MIRLCDVVAMAEMMALDVFYDLFHDDDSLLASCTARAKYKRRRSDLMQSFLSLLSFNLQILSFDSIFQNTKTLFVLLRSLLVAVLVVDVQAK